MKRVRRGERAQNRRSDALHRKRGEQRNAIGIQYNIIAMEQMEPVTWKTENWMVEQHRGKLDPWREKGNAKEEERESYHGKRENPIKDGGGSEKNGEGR